MKIRDREKRKILTGFRDMADFVTYHYVYFEGEGGVFYEIVTYWQMRTKKAQTSTFSALRNHQNEEHR